MKNELNIAPATGIVPTARRPKKPPGRKGKVITVVIIALAAFTAGVVFRPAPTEVTEASLASSESTVSKEPGTATSEPATLPTPSPEPTPEPEGPALLDGIVPLDLETQTEIWEVCGEDQRIFCMVMAIAEKETRFDPEAVGDNGRSIGLMQINARWQYDRIEKLGITDLTDPAQNVAVGIDYIDWLARHINPDDPESTYGYVTWQTTEIGKDINPSELIKRVIAAGAKRVEVASPAFTTVATAEVAQCSGQTANYGGLEDD